MRPNTIQDIRRILYNFSEGKFDRIKVAYLVIRLRDNISDSTVRDIAHFIAHESRNRGKSHKLAVRFLSLNKDFLDPVKSGGRFMHGLKPLIDQETFIAAIRESLSRFDLTLDLKNKEFQFYRSFLQNLELADLYLTEEDADMYSKFRISALESDGEGRESLYVTVQPRPTFLDGGTTGPTIDIGEAVKFENLFTQALPSGVSQNIHWRIRVN